MKRRLRPRITMSVSRLTALAFAAAIALGALLLLLPVSSRSGRSCGIVTALFTSASAVCVTGLSVCDTWTQWSPFGQGVLLVLIELGGLGFMSAASLSVFALRRKMSMSGQMAIAQSVGATDMKDIMRMEKRILIGCFSAEIAGTAALTIRFAFDHPFIDALRLGLFHSVSAFCNAGFDIFGFRAPGSSLTLYGTDPAVLLILSCLIVSGGLGFLVWDDIFSRKRRGLNPYTRLVLTATAFLLLLGTVSILVSEWNNPLTLGGMTWPQKLLAAFFQSVTLRTAGFAGIDQGSLTELGKASSMSLMLIGGSSGSTAGGLKTATFVVMLLFLWSRMRHRRYVSVYGRTIDDSQVLDAVALFSMMSVLSFFGGALLSAAPGVSFTDGLFEAVSAIGTVGLSTGITASLPLPCKLLLIVYMYFGRVGLLTVSLGLLSRSGASQSYRFARIDIPIG